MAYGVKNTICLCIKNWIHRKSVEKLWWDKTGENFIL